MADGQKGKEFPDVSEKLSALPKKSLFERQRAEAEAKRALEEAETAAVYEDFVKSFEDEGDAQPERRRFKTSFDGGPGRPARRHFASNNGLRRSGPGTLGPPPSSFNRSSALPSSSLPPPSTTSTRKRNHGSSSPAPHNRVSAHGGLSSNTSRMDPSGPLRAFRSPSDDEDDDLVRTKEDERMSPKPMLYLASLPLGTSPSVLKSLIPQPLVVDKVDIFPPPNELPTHRKSLAAIVTLASESAIADVDNAVKSLQNKYLGWGYYLTLSRHLSSAALGSNLPTTIDNSNIRTLPFGAKMVQPNAGGLNRAPPPGLHRGGIAPPSSYGPASGRSEPSMEVEVKIPTDIKQLRIIHMTIERVLTDGPIFEAVLMNLPDIQKDEKWFWLWDARSPAGVYYRWRLWQLIADPRRQGASLRPFAIFEDGPVFVPPKQNIKFEFVTRVDQFVSHPDYDTSEDEKSEVEEESDGPRYLNPFRRAKLAFLLGRLPTTHAKLRRGDVARVTAFAIKYAGVAPEEVVEVVLLNIFTPLAYTKANPNREKEIEATNLMNEDRETERNSKDPIDMSGAKLVGLYVMSDIMLASAECGVRHAWRYRQLFESALRSRKVFEHLGRLEKDLGWGKLKAEKWKRSIGNLLQLWEARSVFTHASHEHFVQVFEKPPLTEEEAQKEKEKAEAERAKIAFSKGKSRWRTIDPNATAENYEPDEPAQPESQSQPVTHEVGPTDDDAMDDLDGVPVEDSDLDGVPVEDSDLDGVPVEDSDLDGVPLEDSDMEMADEGEKPMEKVSPHEKEDDTKKPENLSVQADLVSHQVPQRPETSGRPRKPRPKAEDMFASDTD